MRLRVAKKLLCVLLLAACALLLFSSLLTLTFPARAPLAPSLTPLPSLGELAGEGAGEGAGRVGKVQDLLRPLRREMSTFSQRGGELPVPPEAGVIGPGQLGPEGGPAALAEDEPLPVNTKQAPLKDERGGSRGALEEADALWNLVQAHTRPQGVASWQAAPGDCAPKDHVFFAKIHKTGSSTVANILQRYGFTRKLNFALPRKRIHSRSYNYITTPGVKVSKEKLIPPPLGEHYDILWNHAIYDSQFYHQLMPPDTLFISILRQPLQQFQSTFEYYGHIPGSFLYNILQTNVSNPLTIYLHNYTLYEAPGAYTSYIRNKQAQDLGMRNIHVIDPGLRRQYLQQLDRDFQLVMITELFDESLVLLRRLLCWSLKDVLYIPKNRNTYKKARQFTAQDVEAHRQLSEADYELYDFFLARLNRSIAAQGADFEREVRHFKTVLTKVQYFCLLTSGGEGGGGGGAGVGVGGGGAGRGGTGVGLGGWPGGGGGWNNAVLKIGPSEWSRAFQVTWEDCRLMQKHELIFLDDLMVDAIRRYQRSVSKESLQRS